MYSRGSRVRFVIARTEALELCKGHSRSLSLDLYAQWRCMEDFQGKWRFTSPTHTVLAFDQALKVSSRRWRSCSLSTLSGNQYKLVSGMRKLGFTTLEDNLHSPIITAFYSPNS